MSDTAPPQAARILIVEDLASQAELARIFLAGLGYQVRIAATAGAALDEVESWQPDGLLLDIELPDFNGLELLNKLHAQGCDAVVVVVTASASMELAKQAIRAGAEDFVVKPYNKDRLSLTLRNALERRALERQTQVMESQLNDTQTRLQQAEARLGRAGFASFVGASEKMRAVYEIIQGVAPSKASVFITGESGTGKELAAEALHKSSPRAAKKFIALNCGAIPRDLLESEVFGHVKGAFTGATSDRVGAAKLADGGTLFLDEIGEMPLEMQVKLLRFVQTGTFSPVGASRTEKVDVRFVCATNRDPLLEVQAGRFREDLYYRLYVVPLELPPLRERGDDILRIARHFLGQFSKEEHKRFRGFSPEAERLLMEYAWPGNVRQLQNVVRNVIVLHDSDLVTPAMIPPPVSRAGAGPRLAAPPRVPEPVRPPAPAQSPESAESVESALEIAPSVQVVPAAPEAVIAAPSYDAPPPERLPPTPVAPWSMPAEEIEIIPLAEMERRLVMAAIARTGNDIPRAAALLEINPSTVYRKVNAWRQEGLIPQ